MTREEALRQFAKNQEQRLEKFRLEFKNKWETSLNEYADRIYEVLKNLELQAEEGKKITYIYFTFLRCDLLERNYRVMVQAMGKEWYRDQLPLTTYMPVEFLFEGINDLWDLMLDEIRSYQGRIAACDVNHIICSLILECGKNMAAVMRELCWNLEEDKSFKKMMDTLQWSIFWGEYRGDTELICHGDYRKKTKKDWEDTFLQIGKNQDCLVYSYWYQIHLKEACCVEKELFHITFQDSVLDQVDFSRSNLSGACFRNCEIRNCSFSKADLKKAKFIDCKWEETVFEEADTRFTVFSKEGIPVWEFSEAQLEYMLLAE